MNALTPLLEQFIIEARELVAEASDDLLALERDPGDRSRMERVFRAFHTLKGGAAIADLPEMSGLLHAGEDVLDALRKDAAAFDAALVNALFGCIDQVGRWVEVVATTTGRLPDGSAERAGVLAAGLRGHLRRAGAEAARPPPDLVVFDWVGAMIAATPALSVAGRAGADRVVAIAYDPHPGCFFNGDDPTGLLREVPQLVALEVRARAPWQPLQEMDPFACNLAFRALSLAPRTVVAELFRLIPDQVRIAEIPLPRLVATAADDERRALVRKILAAQRALLSTPGAEKEFAGRLDAAARAAKNALRFARADADAGGLDAARAASAASRTPGAMLQALDRLLAPDRPARSDAEPAAGPATSAMRTLRIEEAKVDRLIDVAGELIVAKNSLTGLAGRLGAELGETDVARAIRAQVGVIDRLVAQTHHSAVQLRMVPLVQVFRRFTRIVRDAAQELGKSVVLVVQGGETEADKAVVDAMFEPLLHLVRNALDHGIEPPHERVAAGKPEQAQIGLSAFHQGEQVVIDVRDDGRGIDPAAVRRKAREQALISEEEMRELSDEQVIRLVFAAGLSTSAQVSQMSGRGVGLSAVRASVERFGGSASIVNRPGHGTTIRLALPLSMAFMRIMTVQAGGELFGVPIEAIAETVRMPRSHIVPIKDGEAFVLRDKVVPTCRLDRLLDLAGTDGGDQTKDALVLVTDAGGQTAGIEIDAIGERLDVVVKPMQGLLAEVSDYAGTTLLGNGRVLLVLNLGAVLQ
jgi:two-component system chemotaxis sensor kinase CheA